MDALNLISVEITEIQALEVKREYGVLPDYK